MYPVSTVSLGMQVESYCPPAKDGFPGVPEKAYSYSNNAPSLRQRIAWRTGNLLIGIGTRLAGTCEPNIQFAKDLT